MKCSKCGREIGVEGAPGVASESDILGSTFTTYYCESCWDRHCFWVKYRNKLYEPVTFSMGGSKPKEDLDKEIKRCCCDWKLR